MHGHAFTTWRPANLWPVALLLAFSTWFAFWSFHSIDADLPDDVPVRIVPPEELAASTSPKGAAPRITGVEHTGAGGDPRVQEYRAHLRAFAADLRGTGKVDELRARRLAQTVIHEAYRFGVPPALILGVLLVENPDFRSNAVSPAGARGLMQIMPDTWLPALGRYFGYDLANDEINLRMGIYILALYAYYAHGDYRRTLLRYNGCVIGTRTPDCFSYPDKVRRNAERYALATCPVRSFERCVAVPLAYAFDRR
ncbi:MAG TPA: transglycosylase SLT domain-containing protein [Gemmatimonadaceae bacterium]